MVKSVSQKAPLTAVWKVDWNRIQLEESIQMYVHPS